MFAIGNLTPKASQLFLLFAQGTLLANGHCEYSSSQSNTGSDGLGDGFPVVEVNGVTSEWWEYVRPVGLDSYGGQFFPIMDWTGEPQVCGINGTRTGHETKTLTLEAGSSIKFIAFTANYGQGPIPPHEYDPKSDGVNHNGPGQAYMSLAPGALEEYDGSGDWFKIATVGSTDGQYWDTDLDRTGMTFTIPKTTPPGKYLLRVEHFNISPSYNQTQQFINCAHVEVTGEGGGTPGPFVKFPGAYDIKDPGIWLPRALYHPYKPTDLLKNYKGPGPAIWKG